MASATAIFFGGAGAAAAGGSAAFLSADSSTGGTWQGVYGSDGAAIFGDSARYPAYANVTPSGTLPYTWAGSTGDPRAMQKLASPTDRIAACLYTNSVMSLDVNLTDGNSHQVALYLLDWDNYNGRTQRVEVLDGNTSAVLDTRVASGFTNGQYLVWSLRGHVILRITNINSSSNAVIGGILFGGGSGGSGNSASFLRVDATTQGTWKGTYGGDGAQLFAESGAYPAYAALAPSGNLSYIWAGSTGETRGLQKFASTTDRIASCWYSPSSFSLDLRLTDAAHHQVALYFLDWDYNGRIQRVEVLDADTNAVLDTRTVSGFTAGQYLVWNLAGHVVFRITSVNPATNAVVGGIFFR